MRADGGWLISSHGRKDALGRRRPGRARRALPAELFERGEVCLTVGGELGDLVEQHADGDLCPDREGGLVDPLAGERGDGPGADQDAAAAVGEQPEGAAGVALLGPRPGDGVGEADLGGGGVDAAGAGLGGGEPGGGDLGVGEHHPGDSL